MNRFFGKVLVVCMLTVILSVNSVMAENMIFSDMPANHWAYSHVSDMILKGVVSGYDDGTFRPNNYVNRSEWAKLMTQTAQIPLYPFYDKVIKNGAYDVSENSWYAPYIVTMLPYFDFKSEIFNDGKIITTFDPNKDVTRLEIVKSIIKERGYDLSYGDASILSVFKDCNGLNQENKKYLATAVFYGIISGFDDKTIRPYEPVTRAQACVILNRTYFQRYSDQSESAYRADNSFFEPYERIQDKVAYIPTKERIDFFEQGSWGNQGITLSLVHRQHAVFDIRIVVPQGYDDKYILEAVGTLDENGVFTYNNGVITYVSYRVKEVISTQNKGTLTLKNDYNPLWNDGGYFMDWSEGFSFYHIDYLLGL